MAGDFSPPPVKTMTQALGWIMGNDHERMTSCWFWSGYDHFCIRNFPHFFLCLLHLLPTFPNMFQHIRNTRQHVCHIFFHFFFATFVLFGNLPYIFPGVWKFSPDFASFFPIFRPEVMAANTSEVLRQELCRKRLVNLLGAEHSAVAVMTWRGLWPLAHYQYRIYI